TGRRAGCRSGSAARVAGRTRPAEASTTAWSGSRDSARGEDQSAARAASDELSEIATEFDAPLLRAAAAQAAGSVALADGHADIALAQLLNARTRPAKNYPRTCLRRLRHSAEAHDPRRVYRRPAPHGRWTGASRRSDMRSKHTVGFAAIVHARPVRGPRRHALPGFATQLPDEGRNGRLS